MILTCPECATRYFVADDKVGPQGRVVKCANCGARWTAFKTAEDEPLELTPAPPEPPPEPPAPQERAAGLPGDELPKAFRARAATDRKVREAAASGVIWAALAVILAALIAAAVIFRVDLVRVWPKSAGVFASIGLPVNPVGLVIEEVEAEPALQDGHAALSVSGVIRNVEGRVVTAPPLRITLLNRQGKRVAGKLAAAADPKVPPGETRHFAIVILDPPTSAATLEVAFALEPGAEKTARAAAPKAFVPAEPKLRDSHE